MCLQEGCWMCSWGNNAATFRKTFKYFVFYIHIFQEFFFFKFRSKFVLNRVIFIVSFQKASNFLSTCTSKLGALSYEEKWPFARQDWSFRHKTKVVASTSSFEDEIREECEPTIGTQLLPCVKGILCFWWCVGLCGVLCFVLWCVFFFLLLQTVKTVAQYSPFPKESHKHLMVTVSCYTAYSQVCSTLVTCWYTSS